MKKIFLVLASCLFMSSSFAGLNEILNSEIGESCYSDYDCQSLCCNSSIGACAPHNPYGENSMFCNKEAGQSCVTSTFCRAEAVVTCKIYITGKKPDGSIACALRCPVVLTHGPCTDGVCRPPVIPPVPDFDPNDCSKAI